MRYHLGQELIWRNMGWVLFLALLSGKLKRLERVIDYLNVRANREIYRQQLRGWELDRIAARLRAGIPGKPKSDNMTADERKLVRELVWHIQAMSEGSKDACEEEIYRMATKALAILDAADECPHGCVNGVIRHKGDAPEGMAWHSECPECKPSAKADGVCMACEAQASLSKATHTCQTGSAEEGSK